MGPTTRPNGFPTLHKQTSSNTDGTQRLGSIASRAWPSKNTWTNFGLPNPPARDTLDPIGSDELSPTAPPGPSSSKKRAEHLSWSGRGVGGWPTTTGPETASPTYTQDSVAYKGPESLLDNHLLFPPRQSISQSTSALHSHGMALPSLQTLLEPPSSEERTNSGMYSATGTSQYPRDASGFNRRNSADPSSVGVGPSRPGALLSRQPEANPLRRVADPAQYTWRVGSHAGPSNQRNSLSHASISMTPENTAVSAPFANLEEAFDRGVTLDDATGSLYSGVHRGSVDRGSPAGNSYLPYLNSPRNSLGTLNPRTDPWSRPIPRSGNMSQDMDRQQPQTSQYPHPPPGLYSHYFYQPVHVGLVHDHSPQGSSHRQMPSGQVDYRQSLPLIAPYSYGTNQDDDLSQGARSILLEEFRIFYRTNRRFDLKDIYGHIVEFSGDQHGSRFIQDRLKVANSEEKERVFQELMQNAVQLMKDVFGNYVIQRFFEHGDQVQKKLLAATMMGRVGELSMQMYSCRVVQKALEHVLDDQQREIVDELRTDVVQIAKNQNGNHVMQKAVHMFPRQCIPFILNAFLGQIENLAVHQYACRIIQRILEYGTDDEKKRLLADIHVCAAKLMTDQFGNYVIQHIIESGKPEDRSVMIQQVIDRTLALSRHKYASNVVEKCIVRGTADQRRAIRSKLTTPNSNGTSPLQMMIGDQYGNYVVQKLLSFLEGIEKAEFALELRAYVPQLKKQGNSRQISALERLVAAIKAILEPSASTNNDDGAATSAPSTPNLAVEVSSAVRTPSLTTEQNTPQSSSPPSTNISTADDATEATDETVKARISLPDKGKGKLPVHVQEN
ncbi:ARM repeat-containing protein [Xylaria cf. heliscus]|nr:ARM repeat-containing protein [Xylaria cf. heliscus]